MRFNKTVRNGKRKKNKNPCKSLIYKGLPFGYVERSSELSNQIVKDFKEIADLTYLIPIMEGENQANIPLDKEA